MAALFGYWRGVLGRKGTDRRGLMREADGGALFLDEVEEPSLDEEAVILHAVESGRFMALGSDQESSSRFHLIASASSDLAAVADGRFRSDLCARLNLSAFWPPALKHRREDLEFHIQHELVRAERMLGLCWASRPMPRSATFASPRNLRRPGGQLPGRWRPRGRITLAMIEGAIATLREEWAGVESDGDGALLGEGAGALDEFGRVQCAAVVRARRDCRLLGDAAPLRPLAREPDEPQRRGSTAEVPGSVRAGLGRPRPLTPNGPGPPRVTT